MPVCSQLPGSKHSAPSLLLRIPLPYPKGLPGYAKGMPTLCEGYAKGMPVDFVAKISTQMLQLSKKLSKFVSSKYLYYTHFERIKSVQIYDIFAITTKQATN